jgi:23S rRNA pseudouridine2605 synthase
MPSSPQRPISLARALSKFGVCSRSDAVRWIAAGRVAVDGRIAHAAAERIDPRTSRISVDGVRVGEARRRMTIALHKPVGFVTSRVDPAGRLTVYDLLGDLGRWLAPVGRLDRDSSGLLILTNDTRLGQRLTDPAHSVPKTYHVRVKGRPDAQALEILRAGVPLADGLTRPAQVRALGSERGGGTWLEIVLREGRNRQVRRMCAALGHDVLDLVRVRIGALELDGLASGEWRELDAEDLRRLQQTEATEPRKQRTGD